MFYLHLQSHERYFQAGILGPASFIQWSNRVYLQLIQLGFLSGGSSCVIRLLEKQLLNMRVLHPAHRWSSVVCSAGIIFFMIMPVVCSGIFLIIMSCIFYMMTVYNITVVIISWGFFVFSPARAAVVVLLPFLISCPAPMDDFVVIFITLPPIAIHETTQEQVVPHLPGFRVRNKALQLASSTRTSYLRLVLLKHLGLRGPQKPIHDAFGHRADHGRLRGRAKRYFRTKKKFGMTFPKNRTKKNA